MKSYSISIELIVEIFSRLPVKSVARFRCVSKLWASILDRPYFTELFLTRSSTKPRLLFAIVEAGVWSFFSLPQRQNPYEKSSSSSLVVAAEFHVKFPPDNMRINHHNERYYFACGYASGLIYFYGSNYDDRCVICNPNTGRYATLPYLQRYRKTYSFFVFEPIDKQFKVLFMAYLGGPGHHKIITLGTGNMRWRTIKCSLRHDIKSEGICINGVLYYLGDIYPHNYVIVCFDVRSEKFKFIDLRLDGWINLGGLINYRGKLAVIYWGNFLHMWVLEDVEKQEWSKYAYTLRGDNFFRREVSVAGVSASGEIVFSMREYTSKQPFYVFYFNPKRNNLRRVEIQGFGEAFETRSVYTFVDHVEDLNVIDPKLVKSFDSPHVKIEWTDWSDSD